MYRFKNVNINVAVQTENGLYVPVVKVRELLIQLLTFLCRNLRFLKNSVHLIAWFQDADKKGLSTIGEEVRFLAQKAKENSLKPEDYEVGLEFGQSH